MSESCITPQSLLQSLKGKMPDAPIVVTDLCVKVGCDVLTCVTKTTTFKAKGKSSYTSETVYTDRDGAVIVGAVETACPLKVEIIGQPVEPPQPTEPITIDGKDCDGNTVPVTGNPGELTAVVQAPGTVFSVKLCKDSSADYEKTILCDKNTGHKVAIITKFDGTSTPTVSMWDINAAAVWAGVIDDLESCPDTETESDAIEMCDGGVAFLRWIVKSNGEPTGVHFDTNASGAPYVVTNEAAVTIGKCNTVSACDPKIASANGDALAGLPLGHSVSIQKPSCCAIKVTTSAGAFIVRKGMTAYSTADFACPVAVTLVEVLEGKGTAADVMVTVQKLS